MADEDRVTQRGSPDRFGYEWGEYSEMRPEYETQFRRWACHIPPAEWKGRSFLDVGCGMGRNSYWPHSYGAGRSVSIDVDQRSLASARRTLAPYPDAEVRELSAYEIDYRDEFDIVFSIGVIHHIADPARALAGMVQAAKPGGRVMVWVYGLENNRWIVALLSPLRKALFSKLPIGLVNHLAVYPTALLWVLLRCGMNRIEYFRLIRTLKFRHLKSIVFDQMLPRIAHYWSREQAEALLRDQGLQDIRVEWVNEMSWSVIGTKPA
jgi:SAM-dependent methyltransferase